VPDGSNGRAAEAELAAELAERTAPRVAACKKHSAFAAFASVQNALPFGLHNGARRAAESAAFCRVKNLEKSRSDNMLRVTN
jgi:hypothetical protein